MSDAAFPPADWHEADYLRRYPDVARAVAAGVFSTGHDHYAQYGKREKRIGGWRDPRSAAVTRACFDPWNYLEVTPDFGLKPCCKIPPLVYYEPGQSLAELRDSAPFAQLRRQLLTGELGETCRACHIRTMVPVAAFRHLLETSPERSLLAEPLKYFRVELTTRCNLRCVYCPVSLPHYEGKDLAVEHFDRLLELAAATAPDADIIVNGHGETTCHPHWVAFCEPLLRAGKKLKIITNLGKPLDRAEAACLARFDVVQISLDTVDPELLRRIRRKVALRTIVDNIEKIRQAVGAGTGPNFSISCGVYDRNLAGIENLCQFAIDLGIASFSFWQLVKYDDLPDATNVYSLADLPPENLRQVLKTMDNALERLRAAGSGVEIAGGFLDEWRARASGAAPAS